MISSLRLIAGNLLVLAILVVVAEGLASLALFVRETDLHPVLAERRHTAYDPELGWANLANQRLADFYKAGATLTTNNRGFRGREAVETVVPDGKRRVICSGDSFTLGYGVDDADTWCHRLALHDPSLQTVNMGQGGYGFDQAYLWYRRDGAGLDHHVHVVAFITDDFRRMTLGDFGGYAKPWLAVENGQLVTRNTPVPRASYGPWSWLVRNAPMLEGLRSVELIAKLARRFASGQASDESPPEWRPAGRRAVVGAILEDLARRHAHTGRRFIAVHLPTRYELAAGGEREWTAFFSEAAVRLGFEFVDLFGHFSELPAAERTAMFIDGDAVPFFGADGHYTESGNAEVAEYLAAVLASPPARRGPH